MKNKRLFSLLLTAIMILTMAFSNMTTAYAATGNKTVNSSGSMSIVLDKGNTGNSSIVSFTVSGLPVNAKVTKIEINTGSLTYSGAMLTNYLTLSSSNKTTAEKITWNGAANTTLTSNGFLATMANGTYQISFNCTCIGGAIINGVLTNTGTKSYSRPSIKIYWDDTL